MCAALEYMTFAFRKKKNYNYRCYTTSVKHITSVYSTNTQFMQEDVLPYTLVATLTMDVSPCLLISLEAQPPTPASVWIIHSYLPLGWKLVWIKTNL